MTKILKYINTKYKELPELSSDLKKLFCSNNALLYKLPELPSNLQQLYIINNSLLERLPELPSSLETLQVSNNLLLEKLPELPYDLEFLLCYSNPLLTTLPRSIIYCKKLHNPYIYTNLYKKYNDLSYLEILPYLVNKKIEYYYYKVIINY